MHVGEKRRMHLVRHRGDGHVEERTVHMAALTGAILARQPAERTCARPRARLTVLALAQPPGLMMDRKHSLIVM